MQTYIPFHPKQKCSFQSMRRESKGNKGLGSARFSEVTAFYLAAGMGNTIFTYAHDYCLRSDPPAYCVPLAQGQKRRVLQRQKALPKGSFVPTAQ